ncbi:hypothetical protein LCGC14_0664160 [marine sediment metagenome]|uniref:Uncharacterized protein n=1 Tax=marine sediment metagenome TaxID=412755 RepID=A0A0F9TE59_9ZZZZ
MIKPIGIVCGPYEPIQCLRCVSYHICSKANATYVPALAQAAQIENECKAKATAGPTGATPVQQQEQNHAIRPKEK